VAELTKPLAKGVEKMAVGGERAGLDESDARDGLACCASAALGAARAPTNEVSRKRAAVHYSIT
jgi:hypothetical protein